jgi:hypothetical protein
MPFRRSWGYAEGRALTSNQEQSLNHLLEKYHAVQSHNFVDELDVTEAVLHKSVPFSELTVEEANHVHAHLEVRIMLHTYFADSLPEEPQDFAHEADLLYHDRRLVERVVARAGWDTGEYFFSPHPTQADLT